MLHNIDTFKKIITCLLKINASHITPCYNLGSIYPLGELTHTAPILLWPREDLANSSMEHLFKWKWFLGLSQNSSLRSLSHKGTAAGVPLSHKHKALLIFSKEEHWSTIALMEAAIFHAFHYKYVHMALLLYWSAQRHFLVRVTTERREVQYQVWIKNQARRGKHCSLSFSVYVALRG